MIKMTTGYDADNSRNLKRIADALVNSVPSEDDSTNLREIAGNTQRIAESLDCLETTISELVKAVRELRD